MTRLEIEAICPFFIVSNVDRSIAFYRDKLGFETRYQEPDREPFFAIVGRGGAQLFVKAGEAAPQPIPRVTPNQVGRLPLCA
jgi:catechol 2,3-dioxygenase-like lactoylglutathione lyase family enzyme